MNDATSSPIAVLRQHGKTFYWASIFLGARKAMQAARLYSFCRAADDLADARLISTDIMTTLSLWQHQIQQGQSMIPIVNDILALMDEIKLDTSALENLLQGLISDLTLTRIEDQTQLLQYSYLVAGTVGLMMCSLLGAKDVEAKKFAIDLGIAMQLTNILRDVAEDAEAGRQYIPQTWLPAETNFVQLMATSDDYLSPVFQRLHDLAETYYQSAYAGMIYLPWRSRLSIMIAARLYQEIGLQAKREDFPVLNKRIIVSSRRKCWLILISFLRFIQSLLCNNKHPTHNTALHQAICPWRDALRIEHEKALV